MADGHEAASTRADVPHRIPHPAACRDLTGHNRPSTWHDTHRRQWEGAHQPQRAQRSGAAPEG